MLKVGDFSKLSPRPRICAPLTPPRLTVGAL